MAENLSKKVVKGALAKKGEKHLNHVAIGDGGHEAKKGTATNAQVTIPPPAMGFNLKDEVELLRGGFKNIHGEQVQSQAQGKGGAAPSGGGGGGGAAGPSNNNQPPPPPQSTGKSQDAVEITI